LSFATRITEIARGDKERTGGLAVLWVVFCHCRVESTPRTLQPFSQQGYLAVDLFLMLSGVVLTHVHWIP
jgi:peptidoglycan/LPS O-acetylase OafA/YrhL